MTALYFHWRFHCPEVLECDDAEDAAEWARHESGAGTAAYECIEVLGVGKGAVIGFNEMWELAETSDPHDDEPKSPPVRAWVDLRAPTGEAAKWHRLRGFANRDAADEAANGWAERLGGDRVRVRKAERL